MKSKLLFLVMAAAMLAASVGLTSCEKDDVGDMNSNYVGTWVCEQYYVGDIYNTLYPISNLHDLPATTVALNGNGSCSGVGIVINGKGKFAVKGGNRYQDGYWAIFTFTQDGKVVGKATLTSFTNDYKSGYVKIDGYEDKTFIFNKQ